MTRFILILSLLLSSALFASVSSDSDVTGVGSALPITTKGDLVVTDGSDSGRLAVGTNNQCLIADSGETYGIKWGSCASGSSPLTTKGDIFTYTSSDARLAVGTNGQCLKADSGEASGLIWGACEATVSSTDNALAKFDGTSGVIQDTGIIIDDSNNVSGVGTLASGTHTISGGAALSNVSGDLSLSAGLRLNANSAQLTVTGSRVFSSIGYSAAVFASTTANAADSGIGRLGNTDTICWRNAGNSANICVSVDGSDEFNFGTAALTQTELGYLAGVTGAIQTQLDGKAPTDGDGITDQICGHIETPEDKAYWLVIDSSYPFTINSITTDVDSGTASGALEVNGTPVTGCTSADVSISTTEVEDTCTSGNTITAGDDLEFVISSNSSSDDLRFCVNITRD